MSECICFKTNTEGFSSRTFSNNISTQNFFNPFNDGSYLIQYKNSTSYTNINEISYQKVNFISTDYSNIEYPYLQKQAYIIKKPKNKNEIILLHIQNIRTEKEPEFTLLFSHSNNITLGKIYPTLLDLSISLKCNVISYDYSGYGCSTGSTNETEINDDIINVALFCTNVLHISLNKLILLGDSIGTSPSIYLSSHNQYSELAGVVLIAPTSSGSYVSYVNEYKQETKNKKRKLSIHKTNSKINDIVCPVFLIHGQKDKIVLVSQSHKLSEEIKHSGKSYCWFPKKGTHDNIMNELRRKFYRKFMYFLDLIERFHKETKDYRSKLDLNIRPTLYMGNVSIGKPREENYISIGDSYNNVIPNPISGPSNKVFDSSSYVGNNSSNFIVMNDTERITTNIQLNENKE